MKLFRVILQVNDINAAAEFYSKLLGMPGERVSDGRHYFYCGGTILACFDPMADGDNFRASPNPDHIYISVENIEEIYERARLLPCRYFDDGISVKPWGERSFYLKDPFGNPVCFVDEGTEFTGQG